MRLFTKIWDNFSPLFGFSLLWLTGLFLILAPAWVICEWGWSNWWLLIYILELIGVCAFCSDGNDDEKTEKDAQ
jgi:hypothetical protein